MSMQYGWLWNVGYILFLVAITGVMLWWISDARVRRMKPYRLRGSAAKAWAEALPGQEEAVARFLLCLKNGFDVPKELADCFAPTDTVMSLYLTMYPEHCTYDDMELVHIPQEFKKAYGWDAKGEPIENWASLPLLELFRSVAKTR